MLLIYSEQLSPRLQYICRYLFEERMGVPVSITTDAAVFVGHIGPAICYAPQNIHPESLHIGMQGLLFESSITRQEEVVISWEKLPAFFPVPGADLPFDLFAAAFFLLSRYEEYLPHAEDSYGRFPHTASLAFRAGFLNQPLVDQWVMRLSALLQQRFPAFRPAFPPFRVLPTYDIDMAWSFLHKGWVRNLGGFLRHPSAERIRVLRGQQKDPFDVYDWLDALHEKVGVRPSYFFLLAEMTGRYDKNISPAHPAMRVLVKQHARKYDTGIHPGWQSGESIAALKREISLLEEISGKPVTHSRQHYIRFRLPEGYRRLTEAGITDDYSMGYGSINGFRASVAAAFNWYDLERETTTALRVHPFCFMDANAYYEEGLNAEEAYAALLQYQLVCREVRGEMISIWHNNFLGSATAFAGWKEVYERWVRQLPGVV